MQQVREQRGAAEQQGLFGPLEPEPRVAPPIRPFPPDDAIGKLAAVPGKAREDPAEALLSGKDLYQQKRLKIY